MNVEPLRKILPYTTVAVVIAALYTGYTFYSRSEDQARAERMTTQREAEAGRDSLDRVGGGEMKILHFYALPPAVRKGEASNVCYGVVFAKTVRMEPQTEAIWPSMSHCIAVKPAATTHYTLTAEDGHGRKTTKAVDVEVR